MYKCVYACLWGLRRTRARKEILVSQSVHVQQGQSLTAKSKTGHENKSRPRGILRPYRVLASRILARRRYLVGGWVGTAHAEEELDPREWGLHRLVHHAFCRQHVIGMYACMYVHTNSICIFMVRYFDGAGFFLTQELACTRSALQRGIVVSLLLLSPLRGPGYNVGSYRLCVRLTRAQHNIRSGTMRLSISCCSADSDFVSVFLVDLSPGIS
jgi:hypothetical protein